MDVTADHVETDCNCGAVGTVRSWAHTRDALAGIWKTLAGFEHSPRVRQLANIRHGIWSDIGLRLL